MEVVGGRSAPEAGISPPEPDGEHDRLARAAQQGDHAALQALLELIDADGSIRVPVRRVILNRQQVEDVSHDVLVLVAERLGSWAGKAKFTTWLYTLARNRAIDHLRMTRPAAPLPVEVVSEQRRISSLISSRESLRRLLDGLPERYRVPVIMRDIDGLGYDDIARLLDLHEEAAKTRVRRGRALLAARYRVTG